MGETSLAFKTAINDVSTPNVIANTEAFAFRRGVHLCDDSNSFMSESNRWSLRSVLVHKIGVAERSGRDLDQDLAGAWFRDRHFIYNDLLRCLRD